MTATILGNRSGKGMFQLRKLGEGEEFTYQRLTMDFCSFLNSVDGVFVSFKFPTQ